MTANQLERVWAECLEIIRDNVLEQSFTTWFKPIRPVKLEDKVLTIQVPTQFFYEWLEEHYVTLLHKTIKRVLGSDSRLEYAIVMANPSPNANGPLTMNIPGNKAKSQNPELNLPGSLNAGTTMNPFVIPGLKKVQIDSQLNPQYTFDIYVEGDCNRLARSAGLAIAAKPGGTSFNPLLVYGGVGLGKTHLLHAIGNKIKEDFPQKTVLYVTSVNFTNQIIQAITKQTIQDLVNFYLMVDVLIVDDIQDLNGKEKTQDIFFNIFNSLHQSGKQIIMSSDRSPKDMQGFNDRLVSRFKWGLTADLSVPDYETRLAILTLKMYKDGVTFPHDVVEFVAHNVKSNVRELEGALTSILANASLNQKTIDLDLAKSVMKNLVKEIHTDINVTNIVQHVCNFYNLTPEMLQSKSRKREVVQARQIAIYFTKKFTKLSLKAIGEHFGGRDHTTVIHSCEKIEDFIGIDKKIKAEVEDIHKRIKLNLI